MTVAALPRIVRFVGKDDAPGARCPHCGAEGRYVFRFQVADGRFLGAMRGCVQLFPVAPIAREEERLRDKAKRYEEQGWKLNRADSAALDAIEAFYQGVGTEGAAMNLVKSAKRQNQMRHR